MKACGLSEDCRHLLMVVGHGYVFRFEQRPPSVADRDSEEEVEEEGSGVTSDTEMADAAADGAVYGRQQQQQQLPGDGGLPLPRSSPSAAATPAGAQARQRQQQQQCTPSSCGDRQQQTPAGGGELGVGAVDMAAPASAGSLDALMGCDRTPQVRAADTQCGRRCLDTL